MLIILPYYANVVNSFEVIMNSKHRTEKLKTKTKNQRYRKTGKQNTEGRKPSFTKRIGTKCRLI